MNPLLPGHSGITPEPSRNALNTSQGTNEEDSQIHPRLEVGLSAARWHKTLAQKTAKTWWQELQNKLVIATIWLDFTRKSHTAPLLHLQGSRRKTVLPVNHNSAVKTHLRRSKQTKFYWPFSSWQIITILRTFTILSTEFPNCQSH